MDRSGVRLAYKVFSPDEVKRPDHDGCAHEAHTKHPPIILLHGITNTKETWDNCGQILANKTNTQVYSLDARNHGDSEWTEKIDYINMAEDIVCFMDSMGIPTAIIVGHSMGGKTAMCLALRHPSRIHSMIIEDMSLNNPKSADDFVRGYLVMLREVLLEIPPKTDLMEAKRIAGRYLSLGEQETQHLPLRQKTGGGYEWKTNLDAIQGSISRWEFTPPNLLEGTGIRDSEAVFGGPVLLIYGTHSPLKVLNDKETFLKKFPNTVYKGIEGGKHSIHTEYPHIFVGLVSDFIQRHQHLKSHF